MIPIDQYLNDGANYQAQAVLAVLRSRLATFPSAETIGLNEYHISVGRYENCREQGYVFTLWADLIKQIRHYAVFEHRNSDNLIVLESTKQTINTPNWDDMYGTRGKYDYDKGFNPEQFSEAADYIAKDMAERLIQYRLETSKGEDLEDVEKDLRRNFTILW